MKHFVPTLFAFGVGALCASAQVRSPRPDLMALLPASSRHVFRPSPRQWTKKVEFLRLQRGGGAFIVLQPGDEPNAKTDWREVRYFDSATEKDGNRFRKILSFRPDGSLAGEIDRTSDEQFDLRFNRLGRAIFYDHLVGRKRVAGWSVSPGGKTTHFAGGNGNWIEWNETGSGFTRNWVHDGDFFLIKKVQFGRTVETSLLLPRGEQLRITLTGEELNLWSQHERWGKKTGAPVWAHIDDYHINGQDASIEKDTLPDDEIKRHIRAAQPRLFFRGGPPRKRDPLLQTQLEADYLRRRAAFITNYETLLKSAGQSWKGLELQRLVSPPKP